MRIQNRTQGTLPCQTSETRSTVGSQFTCQGSYQMEQSLRQKTPQTDVLYQQHSRPSHDQPRGRQPSGVSADAILRRQFRSRPFGQQINRRRPTGSEIFWQLVTKAACALNRISDTIGTKVTAFSECQKLRVLLPAILFHFS